MRQQFGGCLAKFCYSWHFYRCKGLRFRIVRRLKIAFFNIKSNVRQWEYFQYDISKTHRETSTNSLIFEQKATENIEAFGTAESLLLLVPRVPRLNPDARKTVKSSIELHNSRRFFRMCKKLVPYICNYYVL